MSVLCKYGDKTRLVCSSVIEWSLGTVFLSRCYHKLRLLRKLFLLINRLPRAIHLTLNKPHVQSQTQISRLNIHRQKDLVAVKVTIKNNFRYNAIVIFNSSLNCAISQWWGKYISKLEKVTDQPSAAYVNIRNYTLFDQIYELREFFTRLLILITPLYIDIPITYYFLHEPFKMPS